MHVLKTIAETALLIAVVLFFGWLLPGCGGGGGGGSGSYAIAAPPQAPEPAPPPKKRIVCSVELDGDSIMAGQSGKGLLAVKPAIRLNQLRPAYTIYDNAWSGRTAAQGWAEFPNHPRMAEVIVLSYGTNDINRKVSPQEPMELMSEYAEAEGRKVIITGMSQQDPEHPLWREYSNDLIAAAKMSGAAYAGWDELTITRLDGVHPDQEGSNRLVERLVLELDKILPECK